MNTLNATLGPLVSPDEQELSYTDKQAAHAKIESAARLGVLSAQQAADRHRVLNESHRRGHLREVLAGLHDAVPPSGLTLALRIAAVGWLAVCVIQFVIWLALAAFGHLDWPWWLWSDVGLGLAVGILWWTHESYHRKSQLDPGTSR
ncbi:hypothetical protein [Streptomyces sp. SID13031]|uniref:hypothetical protein n=1 Tax=Streptomyces sp. SID13031 TaxID=2706046 RepID=UPI0013CC9569|nr:hypothetical protein [Streptomyces sp. SID13031]NEA33719.1 hypothetical protein [Streptomyces sp. SID13031]